MIYNVGFITSNGQSITVTPYNRLFSKQNAFVEPLVMYHAVLKFNGDEFEKLSIYVQSVKTFPFTILHNYRVPCNLSNFTHQNLQLFNLSKFPPAKLLHYTEILFLYSLICQQQSTNS